MSRRPSANIDIARNVRIEDEIARRGGLGLKRHGVELTGPCPDVGCGGHDRFSVNIRKQIFNCRGCGKSGDVIALAQHIDGTDFVTAIKTLGGEVPIDPEQAERLARERETARLQREQESNRYREAERKRLWQMWKASKSIEGTLAAAYLAGRGLVIPPGCTWLRFAPSCAYFHGDEEDERGRKSPHVLHRGPAMLARFVRPDDHFGGLHITHLDDADPPGKLKLADPDDPGKWLPAKKMRGSKTGAYILVAPAVGALRRLVVGEGIETVLSVFTAFVADGRDIAEAAFWAAGDLGNLAGPADERVDHPTLKQKNGRPQRVPGPAPDLAKPGLPIPDSVEELILLGDGDSEQILTECAMERAARRYGRPGRTIRIAFAPAGRDFNDVLLALRSAE